MALETSFAARQPSRSAPPVRTFDRLDGEMRDPLRIERIFKLLRMVMKARPHDTLGEIFIACTGKSNPHGISDEDLVRQLRSLTLDVDRPLDGTVSAEQDDLLICLREYWLGLPQYDLAALLATFVHTHHIYDFHELSDEMLIYWLVDAAYPRAI